MAARPVCLRRRRRDELRGQPPEAGPRQRQVHPRLPHARRRRGTKEVLARPGRYKPVRDNLRVKEVIVGDGERRRRYVVCHNPAEEKRQRDHRAKVIKELEAELATMQTRADGKLSQRARELSTSGRYGKYVRDTQRGALRVDHAAIHEEERYDGKWVVTSNDDTLTAEDLALGYKQLLRVEACWRQLKSGLKMRPVFHYRPWRIVRVYRVAS